MKLERKIFWLAAAALVLGLVGLGDRLLFGHAHAGYGSYVVWGLGVAMYLFFAGLAAGAFAVATLDLLFKMESFKGIGRMALWTALVSLAGALLTIWFDLGHMARVWKVYLQPNFHSVMTQMVWGYTIFGIVILATLREAIRNPTGKTLRFLLVAGLPLALFTSGAVGALLGVEPSRPFWQIGFFPVQFPVFAYASGSAALLAILGLFGRESDPKRLLQVRVLGLETVVLSVAKLYFLWAFLSQAMLGSPQQAAAVQELLFGQYWWAFWILQLLVGTAIPIAVLVHPRLSRDPAWAGWMGVIVLASFAVARANFVFPALTVPEFGALAHSFSGSPRLQFQYFPSLVEWAVTIGVTGFVTLAFLVGSDRMSLREKEVA